jgi:hypothetical protein
MRTAAHVALFFLVASLAMTWPLAMQLGSGLKDHGDPLLNSWILAWEAHAIANLDFAGFFDTNIFYPNRKTLAYSELMLPQALLGAPLQWLSGNPILVHNFVLLLSLSLAGFGAWALANELTGDRDASLLAGLIFAYCPFMVGQLSHVQVLWAGCMPLTLLFFHRYQRHRRRRDLLLTTFFYLAQVLGNAYFGLYLTLFLGLFMLHDLCTRRRWAEPRALLDLGLFSVLAAAIAGPFFAQYLEMQELTGFDRWITEQASLGSYVSTVQFNRLYGELTAGWWSRERTLFPGLATMLLAAAGIGLNTHSSFASAHEGDTRRSDRRRALVALDLAIVATFALIGTLLATRGFGLEVGEWHISLRGTRNPTLAAVALLLTRRWLARRHPEARGLIPLLEPPLGLYADMVLLSFLFTFGDGGPYTLLFDHLPGFGSLRVAARFAVMVMLGLSILAAFGAVRLRRRLSPRAGVALIAACGIAMAAEYSSVPLPLRSFAHGEQAPAVYHWLAEQPGDFAIAHYPLRQKPEYQRLAHSTLHWKKIVNGWSGLLPPLFEELRRRQDELPFSESVAALEELGVRYLLLEPDLYRPRQRRAVLDEVGELGERLRPIVELEGVSVYELVETRAEAPEPGAPPATDYLRGKASWRVDGQPENTAAHPTIDADLDTRWQAGVGEATLEIDLGREARIEGVVLDLRGAPHDYPRAYRVELSAAGADWTTVAEAIGYQQPIVSFLRQDTLHMHIPFAPATARHLKLTATRPGPDAWSVAEVDLLPAIGDL